jgi:hypothetical protein
MEGPKFLEINMPGFKCQFKECAPINGLQFCDVDVSDEEK